MFLLEPSPKHVTTIHWTHPAGRGAGELLQAEHSITFILGATRHHNIVNVRVGGGEQSYLVTGVLGEIIS